MASTCFCGCGREVGGIRRRANNEAASQIAQYLATMEGALARDEAGDRTAETRAMVDEGTALVAAIKQYLHGEVTRDDLDPSATKDWLKRAKKLSAGLVKASPGPAWAPDDSATAHLAQAGRRAKGVITDVRRDGMGNERVADLAMTVAIAADDGGTVELTRSLSIAVVRAPRVGDRVEVAYDTADPNRFVYRPLIELPPDDTRAALP